MRRVLVAMLLGVGLAVLPLAMTSQALGFIQSLQLAWPLSGSNFAEACFGDPATPLAAHHLIVSLLGLAGLVEIGRAMTRGRNRVDRRLDPFAWWLRYVGPAFFALGTLYYLGPLLADFGRTFQDCSGRGPSGRDFLLMIGLVATYAAARFVVFATSEPRR